MIDTLTVQGLRLSQGQVSQIQDLIQNNPDWSRYRLSRQLCVQWDWRTPVGQYKDMAARSLLLKLEKRGMVQLPPCRCVSPNRHRLAMSFEQRWDDQPIEGSLTQLGPIRIEEVSQVQSRQQIHSALAAFHYLGYRTSVGENLQYRVCDDQGRLLAVLVFGAAAWKCACRDQWIGWSSEQRQRNLCRIANNSRFLIMPWIKIEHLASWVLGRIARRINTDWQAKYGHRIGALETFVERDRFNGTCYRAANWQRLGSTTGRSRQDRNNTLKVPVKEIYLYPLTSRWREELCA